MSYMGLGYLGDRKEGRWDFHLDLRLYRIHSVQHEINETKGIQVKLTNSSSRFRVVFHKVVEDI